MYANLLEKKDKTKRSLKPLAKNEDPHKRLINNISSNKKSEINITNNLSNSHKSTDPSWKFDKALLDDSEFRKTHMKKKERLEISCENIENVQSAFNFDFEKDEENVDEFENNFNNLVSNNLNSEYSQVTEFLDGIGLNKYLSLLIENNIDSFQKIICKFYFKLSD